ncbi:cystathionine beta-lyase [Geoalkalibacter ferrihydriticus]|uniref:cysteine-S-conjugate beta-lyase n=2 Tax=Geoalkalibacter ferrihydriticus TaxID=392333 RepID=A0A0C2HYM4_9BACT|nr:PLP-dependent aspartate aminotransferase family protein [Geoalkalibacter ferrihydriticus]KIH77857.1 cystathionine gamma-synthase [Geoalkalibacter ferrihydriticus DSM 17813]SDL82862.1 cystathionine beta-lyase [Geoalkalibacter ferrihydriticus]
MSKSLRPATLLVHQGRDRDPATGAANIPVYLASTYHHFGGRPGEYDYARSGNPSRDQVEEAIALLENGVRGFAYASGMAAVGGALALLKSGDHVIAPDDLYGGTYRYLTLVLPQQGISVSLVNMTDPQTVENAIRPETRALFLETPSNPLFKISDLRALVEIARRRGLLTLLDNTFMTPLLQPALELGIDVAIHSATKFLGGHSDLLAGLVTTADPELAAQLKRFQNAMGATLAPFDCFLLARGIKTLKVRLEAAQTGAQILAERLVAHPAVARVYYPGLAEHPGRAVHFSQAAGPGAVLSFELKDRAGVTRVLEQVKLPIIAPSLGGVETILTHCWSMSHAAIPAPVKEQLGIRESLLRISTGIEDPEDLWEDLANALGD